MTVANDCLNIITNINHQKTLFRQTWQPSLTNWNGQTCSTENSRKSSNLPLLLRLKWLEHELHFLFNCNLFDSLRSTFYRNISNRYPLFNNSDNKWKNSKKPSSYLTISILISTELQLLTYIHVWNIDKKLVFNYSLFLI